MIHSPIASVHTKLANLHGGNVRPQMMNQFATTAIAELVMTKIHS